MKLPFNAEKRDVGFNMTPMIDVVFLLIIFFLVSSHLAKQEAQLQLPLPEARSGNTPTDMQTPRLTVNVLADGQLMLAGRKVQPAELLTRLQERIAEDGPNLKVRIRGDRAVHYRFVQPVMTACAQAGIWDVAFAVFQAKGETR